MIELRDYQIECVCVKSPTSSGKTIIFSEVINRVYKNGSRVL